MPTKPRLSPQQHAEMGQVLAAIRDELAARATQLKNAYPRTGSEATPGRKIATALSAIDGARNSLDEALFREHPDAAEPTTYYPCSEDRPGIARILHPRGARPLGEHAITPCPACSVESTYARELDRYVHRDGSSNRACWLAISRGQFGA